MSSEFPDKVQEGLDVLAELIEEEGPQREYLYFTAQGYYALGKYETALQWVRQLQHLEPNNRQAAELEQQIWQRRKEGMVFSLWSLWALMVLDGISGVAIVGGVIVAAAAVHLLSRVFRR